MALPFPPGSLFLAPMVSLSHRPLRTLIGDFGGLDYAVTEMTSAAGLASGSQFGEWYLDVEPAPARTMIQLAAAKPERLVEALGLCAGKPAMGVDLNFGCAAPHIKAAGCGVAWMDDPEGAGRLARAARAAWPRLLSAKLRIGPEEDYGRLLDFCMRLVEAGIDFLTLHPRLASEKLRRSSRWDFVGRLAADLPVPVVGNGDVRSFTDFAAKLESARPAGIMIGREAARRPWIFALIKGRLGDPGFELEIDLAAAASRFMDLLEAHLPREFHLTRARRFFFYFADNFSFAHHIKWKLQNSPDLPSMRSALAAYFDEVPGDRRRIQRD